MKKVLNAILVFALLLTMVTPAFAAAPSDVDGTKYEDAVTKLQALGIVSGYADGTFGPEDAITRGQFAKLVAYAAGFSKAAELLGNSDTGFPDVSSSHWAAGYISVASNKGYLNGYADGRFGLNDNVTYAQATAVLLRLLGYNDEGLVGNWPTNYVIKASELGLLDDVDFDAYAPATRGEVALLLDAALEQTLVTYNKDADTFNDVTKTVGGNDVNVTLLDKAFETAIQTGILTDAPYVVGSTLEDNEVKLDGTVSVLAEGVSVDGLLGHTVKYIVKSDEVVYVTNATAASNVKTGTVDADSSAAGLLKLKDVKDADEPTLAGTVYYYINGEASDLAGLNAADPISVTYVLDADGKVQSVLASEYAAEAVPFKEYTAATTLNAAKVTYYDAANLGSTNIVTLADNVVLTLNGATASFDDLEKYDVINTVVVSGKVTKVEAFRDVVEGKVTQKVNGTDVVVTIGGNDYTLNATVYGDTLSVSSTTEYTVHLDKDGDVAYATIVAGTDSDIEGIVVSVKNVDVLEDNEVVAKDRIKVYQSNGTVVTFDVADGTANDVVNTGNGLTGLAAAKQYGTFTFDADGEFKTFAITYADVTSKTVDVSKAGASILEITDGNYFVTTDTLFFDVTKTNATTGALEPELVSYDDLKTTDQVDYVLDGSEFSLVFITNGGLAVSEDALPTVYGIFVGKTTVTTADGDKWYATVSVDGVEQQFEINNDFASGTLTDKFVSVVDTNKAGYETVSEVATVTPAAANAIDATAKTLTDNTAAPNTNVYGVTSNTTIYVYDTSEDALTTGSFADLQTAVTNNYSIQLDTTGVTYGANGAIQEAAVMYITAP